MHFPLWVDLKGQDSVPDTVHHVVCMVDPSADRSWIRFRADKTFGITVRIQERSLFNFRRTRSIRKMKFDQVQALWKLYRKVPRF